MTIAPDTTGNTPVTSSATSATVDITAAAVGAAVYCWCAISTDLTTQTGVPSNASWTAVQSTQTTAGTSGATYALYRRVKQSGDTTFLFSWTSNAKGIFAWQSYTGLNPVTPDEQSAITQNDTTSRTAVPTPTASPATANRWALACFGCRSTTSANKAITWTPDAATTERADANNSAAASAAWLGVEIADSAGAVTQASHSYTATHAPAAESHDGSALLFLIPAATAGTAPAGPRLARQVQPLRGRITSRRGAPLSNPTPVFYPLRGPARARLPQPHPRAGRAISGPGTPAPSPAGGLSVKPLAGPVRARQPTAPRGRVCTSPGTPVPVPAATPRAYPLAGPARARLPQAIPRGRVAGSAGAPAVNPVQAQFAPLRKILHAQPAVFLRGRTASSPAAPVANPTPGPRVYPLPGPVRARLPQLHPRAGRITRDKGAPVFIPVIVLAARPVLTAGPLRLRWAQGGAPGRWREADLGVRWDASTGPGRWAQRESARTDWTEEST